MQVDARLLEPVTGRIMGCAFRVANALGPGFVEKAYQNALAHEARKCGLGVVQQRHPRARRWRQAGRWPECLDRIWHQLEQRHGKSAGTREMITLVRVGSVGGWDRLIAAVEEALRLGRDAHDRRGGRQAPGPMGPARLLGFVSLVAPAVRPAPVPGS